jgi:IS30 family transposase
MTKWDKKGFKVGGELIECYLKKNNYREANQWKKNIIAESARHLLPADRIKIEELLRAKTDNAVIAQRIGCSQRTLEREIELGSWFRRDAGAWEDVPTYSYDLGKWRHCEKAKNKGRYAKINDNPKMRAY